MVEKTESPLRLAVLIAALGTLTTIVFIPALRLPLLADDYNFILRGRVPGWWHSSATWDFGTTIFRPIPLIWIGTLDHTFGIHPLRYHIASTALLVGAGVVVAMIARRLGLGIGAYAAAGVYCLHASMAAPVGWAAAVNSPLATLLSLTAVYILLRPRIRPVGVVAACVLFAVALMTREVVAVAPAILLMTRYLVETAPDWRVRARRALFAAAPLVFVLIAYGAVRRLAGFSSSSGPYAQKLSSRGLTNLGRLMQIATDVDGFASARGYTAFVTLFWVVLIGLCILAAWRGHRPQGVIGILWAFVGVLPVVFLAVHAMDFYYVDYALPGIALAVGTLVQWAVDELPDRAGIALATVCLALFVAVSANTERKELDAKLRHETRHAQLIIGRVKRQYPSPPKGSTIIVREAPGNYLTANGNAFRVIYNDPTLNVLFVPR